MSSAWIVRRVRPCGTERESQRFQSPVTVFTLKTVASAVAPTRWPVFAHSGAPALFLIQLVPGDRLEGEQGDGRVGDVAVDAQPTLVPLAHLHRLPAPSAAWCRAAARATSASMSRDGQASEGCPRLAGSPGLGALSGTGALSGASRVVSAGPASAISRASDGGSHGDGELREFRASRAGETSNG